MILLAVKELNMPKFCIRRKKKDCSPVAIPIAISLSCDKYTHYILKTRMLKSSKYLMLLPVQSKQGSNKKQHKVWKMREASV